MIFHFTVRGASDRGQASCAADAETGKRRPDDRARWRRHGNGMRAVGQGSAEHLFGRRPHPIAVIVDPDVDPATQAVHAVDRDHDIRGLPLDKCRDDDPVLIVVAVNNVVAQRVRIGLTVEFGIGPVGRVTQPRAADHVPSSGARRKRRVRPVRRVAPVVLGVRLGLAGVEGEGQIHGLAVQHVVGGIAHLVPRPGVRFAAQPPDRVVVPVVGRGFPAEVEGVAAGRAGLNVQPVHLRVVGRPRLDKGVAHRDRELVAEANRVARVGVPIARRIIPTLPQTFRLDAHSEGSARERGEPEHVTGHAEALYIVRRDVAVNAENERDVAGPLRRQPVLVPRTPDHDVGDRALVLALKVVRQNQGGGGIDVHAFTREVGALHPLGRLGLETRIDDHLVIFHFTVLGAADRAQSAHSTDAETGKRRPDDRAHWRRHGNGMRAVGQGPAEHVFGRRPHPVAVVVDPDVDPATQAVHAVDRDHDIRGLPLDKCRDDDPVLIVVAVNNVVAQRVRIGLTVEFGIGPVGRVTQPRAADHVPGSGARRKRRVRSVRRVAPVQQFFLFLATVKGKSEVD